ncbi:MAG: SDR family oxidoreductase [Sphingobacteriales bacterium]|nr:MAG: SDR family oxidoreductase [Sphingobacteriales bacterium]
MFAPHIFDDKIVVVTGGGSGIGMAIAGQFLKYGAKVYIASRKEERLQESLKTLQPLGNCDAFALDIRNPEQAEQFANYIKEKDGRLDILINNAGGQFPSAAEMISTNGWNAVINTNLNGTFYLTRQMFLSFFMNQQHGTVVNIIANIYRGFPGMAHTGAARAGVDNLTKTLAVEWSPYNVRINAIAPGIIKSSGLDQYPPDMLKGITDKIPLKRLGETSEVAYLTLFLSSPMAGFITGETVYIDGGQRLWGDMWEM